MAGPKDVEIAHLAVQRGLISRGQLDEATAELTRRLDQSENPTTFSLSLVNILIAKGYLRAEDVTLLLGQSPPEPQPEETPDDVRQAMKFPDSAYGKYVILRLLGTGGMGAVYRAWDAPLKRYVALKFLTIGSDDNIRRFIREAQTAARLNHPNIAQVFDTGAQHGRHFIAMEYIDGLTLDQLPEGIRRAELEKIVRLMREVALAVDYAHSKGVVHRDLKPQNVMIDEFLKPHIMDFGLARPIVTEGLAKGGASPSRRQITVAGTVVGTPNFLSPEQARGGDEELDPRTDIYSLGATLFTLVAGVPPFDGPTPLEILMRVIQDDPPRPSSKNPAVTKDLETVILRCLEKEPARRYQTAREVADELQRILSGEPILARKAGMTLRLRRLFRKRPAAMTMIIAATLLISSVTFFATRLIRLEEEHRAVLLQKATEEDRRRQEDQRRAEARVIINGAEPLLTRVRRMQIQEGSLSAEAAETLRRAMEDLSRAIQRDGQNAEGYLLRGQGYGLQGDLERALPDFTLALRLHPEIHDSLDQKLKLDPDNADAHELACQIRVADRRWREAVEAGERALQIEPRLGARLAPWLDRARQRLER